MRVAWRCSAIERRLGLTRRAAPAVQAGGWGIHVGTRGPLGRDNVVKCDNKAPSAALGLSNLKCTP